jgi:hypothetical protein
MASISTQPLVVNDLSLFESERFPGDLVYALKVLKQGASEDQVVKDIAEYRADLPATDQIAYAQHTVDQASTTLLHEEAINRSLSKLELSPIDERLVGLLDKQAKDVTTAEYARRLYSSGLDVYVTDLLEDHRGLTRQEAVAVANRAAAQVHAESDVEYAISRLAQHKNLGQIASAISRYRGLAVNDPDQYGRDVVQTAQQIATVETDIPVRTLINARIQVSAHKFSRDVKFAWEELGRTQDKDQALLLLQQRNPNVILGSFRYHIRGRFDHSYPLAVLSYAEALQAASTSRDFKPSIALDAIHHEFKNHLSKAIADRRSGATRACAIDRITEGDPVKHRYAQAVLEEADEIISEERSSSIRPELTSLLAQQFEPQEQLDRANFHTANVELSLETMDSNACEAIPPLGNGAALPEGCHITFANSAHGSYSGKVVGETVGFFVQQIRPKAAVMHSKDHVGTEGMVIGRTYTVRYTNGTAALQPRSEKRVRG